MCGIAGIMFGKDSNKHPGLELIKLLYDSIDARGKDAVGYGTWVNGYFYILKGEGDLDRFWPMFEERWKAGKIPVGSTVFLHTRAATIGDPAINDNNHPFLYESNKRNVMAMHNGTLIGTEEAYKELEVKPIAEVDSAFTAVAVGELGLVDGIEYIAKALKGTGAITAMDNEGNLVLVRASKPLFIGGFFDGGLVWSSTEPAIRAVCSHSTFNIRFSTYSELKADSGFFISADGMETKQLEFKLPYYNYQSQKEWEKQQQQQRVGLVPIGAYSNLLERGREQRRAERSSGPMSAEEVAAAGGRKVGFVPSSTSFRHDFTRFMCRYKNCGNKCSGFVKLDDRVCLVCSKHLHKMARNPNNYIVDVCGMVSKFKV